MDSPTVAPVKSPHSSEVARAAVQLIAANKRPTVDSVWQALGGIGSKSTVARFLKRWRAKQEDTAIANAALSVPLLSALRGPHEPMQAEFQQKREALEQRHSDTTRVLKQQLEQLQANKDLAVAENLIVEGKLVCSPAGAGRSARAISGAERRHGGDAEGTKRLATEIIGLGDGNCDAQSSVVSDRRTVRPLSRGDRGTT